VRLCAIYNPLTESGNEQRIWFFPNGYGASVIRGPYTYGGPAGLFELAVLRGTQGDSALCYDTPITNDVLGHQTEAEIETLLVQIEALPKAKGV
jgi:hypothetical protein